MSELDKTHPAVAYDLEHFYWIDRREMPHKMKVAVDLRDPGKRGGMWVYWGSNKTLIGAIRGVWKARKELLEDNGLNLELRLLDTYDYSVIIHEPLKLFLQHLTKWKHLKLQEVPA